MSKNIWLVEVIGQYFKVITNQQDHHVRRFSTKVWDEKHNHGEKYYSSMVKVLKQRKLQEFTNDEFSIALDFLLDVLDGKIVFYNFNLPEFREYCIEAGHFLWEPSFWMIIWNRSIRWKKKVIIVCMMLFAKRSLENRFYQKAWLTISPANSF